MQSKSMKRKIDIRWSPERSGMGLWVLPCWNHAGQMFCLAANHRNVFQMSQRREAYLRLRVYGFYGGLLTQTYLALWPAMQRKLKTPILKPSMSWIMLDNPTDLDKSLSIHSFVSDIKNFLRVTVSQWLAKGQSWLLGTLKPFKDYATRLALLEIFLKIDWRQGNGVAAIQICGIVIVWYFCLGDGIGFSKDTSN